MALPFDRMTVTGLGIAALGWVALAGDAALGLLTTPAGPMMTALTRSDIFTVSEATVVSGFAVALLGTLRTGFGALNGFFDAVLARASGPRAASPAPAPPPAPSRVEPVAEPIEPVIEVKAAPARQQMRGRNYTILPNGAVEVDTLLGTRVFASLDEARNYIR